MSTLIVQSKTLKTFHHRGHGGHREKLFLLLTAPAAKLTKNVFKLLNICVYLRKISFLHVSTFGRIPAVATNI